MEGNFTTFSSFYASSAYLSFANALTSTLPGSQLFRLDTWRA
jgi:hypothetical protein